jgi:chemotaxis protein CheC
MVFKELDHIRLDVLRELSSIATGHAATSLSAMIGKRVDITVPNILVEAVEKVPDVLGGKEQDIVVVYFSVKGEMSGSILLALSSSEALRLSHILTGQQAAQVEDLDEMGLSALKELGNIITGSYLRVFSQELKMKIIYSVPGFAHDMLGAVMDELLARLSLEAEYAIIAESEFIVREEIYRGYLIFILSLQAVNATIKALGMYEG